MKILVLSNTPWDNNNSFGNSYSNIFEGMGELEFANIYCRTGIPNNKLPMQCFQITTGAMAKSVFKSSAVTGHIVNKNNDDAEELSSQQKKMFDYARKRRWILLFWMKELIWRIGKWKSKELLAFLDDFRPNLIFQPIYGQGCSYINRIALFIKDYTKAPMVGYVSDDCYTFRQLSLSPLYWIDRIARHGVLKKNMQSCKILYVISEVQKKEYAKMLNVPCKVLTKGISDENKRHVSKSNLKPIKMVYAGNVSEGRWKTLSSIGEALDEINNNEIVAELDIYTATPLSKKMERALKNKKSIHFKGRVDVDVIPSIYENSDILVHAESFQLKERLSVHQSFSTKLVDYFEIGKCIFAVGPADVASIEHLVCNDAAVVAVDESEIIKKLKWIIDNPDSIEEFGLKAWECGKKKHLKKNFQQMLRSDFKSIV